jgi:hypothetical protein
MSSATSRFNRRSSNEFGFKSERGLSGSVGSGVRRRIRKCSCGEFLVLRTVTDESNPNYGEKFWGCRNWRNRVDNGCNHFQWVENEDDVVDDRDVRIAKQKKKNGKLKHEICCLKDELFSSRKCCKIAIGFATVSFGLNLVFMSLMLSMFVK